MTSLNSKAKWYFVGGLVALLAAIYWVACTSSPTPAPAPTHAPAATASLENLPPTPTMSSPSLPTPHESEPKEMTGTVESSTNKVGFAISKSDVSGLSDSPITKGEVLFIPEEHAVDLAAAGDFDLSEIDGMRRTVFQLDQSQLAKLSGTAEVIDADGRFHVDIPAGHYFICLANVFIDHTAGPPYSVVGCDGIDLPNEVSLTVSFGIGGVEAILDRE